MLGVPGDLFLNEGGAAFKKMLEMKADRVDLDRVF